MLALSFPYRCNKRHFDVKIYKNTVFGYLISRIYQDCKEIARKYSMSKVKEKTLRNHMSYNTNSN